MWKVTKPSEAYGLTLSKFANCFTISNVVLFNCRDRIFLMIASLLKATFCHAAHFKYSRIFRKVNLSIQMNNESAEKFVPNGQILDWFKYNGEENLPFKLKLEHFFFIFKRLTFFEAWKRNFCWCALNYWKHIFCITNVLILPNLYLYFHCIWIYICLAVPVILTLCLFRSLPFHPQVKLTLTHKLTCSRLV